MSVRVVAIGTMCDGAIGESPQGIPHAPFDEGAVVSVSWVVEAPEYSLSGAPGAAARGWSHRSTLLPDGRKWYGVGQEPASYDPANANWIGEDKNLNGVRDQDADGSWTETDPLANDSDVDGILDGAEVNGSWTYKDGTAGGVALDPDTDFDSLSNLIENECGTDPNNNDTDPDGKPNADGMDPLARAMFCPNRGSAKTSLMTALAKTDDFMSTREQGWRRVCGGRRGAGLCSHVIFERLPNSCIWRLSLALGEGIYTSTLDGQS